MNDHRLHIEAAVVSRYYTLQCRLRLLSHSVCRIQSLRHSPTEQLYCVCSQLIYRPVVAVIIFCVFSSCFTSFYYLCVTHSFVPKTTQSFYVYCVYFILVTNENVDCCSVRSVWISRIHLMVTRTGTSVDVGTLHYSNERYRTDHLKLLVFSTHGIWIDLSSWILRYRSVNSANCVLEPGTYYTQLSLRKIVLALVLTGLASKSPARWKQKVNERTTLSRFKLLIQ